MNKIQIIISIVVVAVGMWENVKRSSNTAFPRLFHFFMLFLTVPDELSLFY